MRELPFPLALEDEELERRILGFDERLYLDKLDALFRETETVEDGRAAGRVADFMRQPC